MTNAETVDLCGKLGVPVKSHSSSLQEAYADMVRRRAERDGLTRAEQPPEPESEKKPAKKAAAKKTTAKKTAAKKAPAKKTCQEGPAKKSAAETATTKVAADTSAAELPDGDAAAATAEAAGAQADCSPDRLCRADADPGESPVAEPVPDGRPRPPRPSGLRSPAEPAPVPDEPHMISSDGPESATPHMISSPGPEAAPRT